MQKSQIKLIKHTSDLWNSIIRHIGFLLGIKYSFYIRKASNITLTLTD